MSHGLCTLSHVSYATQPRYCRNYALKIYDARRNRRNAPSVARFSLPCHPWQGISVYRVHNSTVSKQFRYALMRESVPQPVTCDEAPHTVAECRLIGVQRRNSKKNYDDKELQLCYNQLKALYFCKRHHITVFQVRTTLKRADHFASFYKGHGSFQCFNYPLTAGKLKCRMQTEYRKCSQKADELYTVCKHKEGQHMYSL